MSFFGFYTHVDMHAHIPNRDMCKKSKKIKKKTTEIMGGLWVQSLEERSWERMDSYFFSIVGIPRLYYNWLSFCFQCIFFKEQCPTIPLLWLMITEDTSSPLGIEISYAASLTNGILTGIVHAWLDLPPVFITLVCHTPVWLLLLVFASDWGCIQTSLLTAYRAESAVVH